MLGDIIREYYEADGTHVIIEEGPPGCKDIIKRIDTNGNMYIGSYLTINPILFTEFLT